MDEIWATVHSERKSLANDLDDLPVNKWSTPSLCDGWTVHDVLAHLVDDSKTTKVSFVTRLILARFNFDRVNQNGVDRERQQSPENTLTAFRQVVDRTSNAPAPLASRLVEVIVHGEDIRRPLGIPHDYPEEAIIDSMNYQLETSDSTGGSKKRAAGLHLIATDINWSHGEGSEVRGNAIDLLLALTGRSVPPDALSGDGVHILLGR